MGVTVGKFSQIHPRPPCLGEVTLNISIDPVFDYDLIIIGGGSGGLAAAKTAVKYGKRVAICDFVKPSPAGNTWGLGGTCVNVGCIPKKLMHQAALLGQSISDSSFFGWKVESKEISHDWKKMAKAIQDYIKTLNWGYKVSLHKDGIDYFNAFAHFLDNHTVILSEKEETRSITSEHFIIAVGGRPKYLEIEGGRPGEFCITSDDIFSLGRNPGKVLLIGGSYVSLECAGFLAGFGLDTTVMVRSILLRGFDQQMANLVGNVLEQHGVRLLRGWIPTIIEKVVEEKEELLSQYLVTSENHETKELSMEIYNTIILAVGRDPCTKELHLENAGIEVNPETGKIITDLEEKTSLENIFAIGDVAQGRPELTPVAIQAGVLLVKRLYDVENEDLVDYNKVPTTIFTPLEYGCVGYSEEDAARIFGQEYLEVYHLKKQPLEFTLPSRDKTSCYSKIICVKSDSERVVGFHYLGPNAGEVTQGFALALKLHATKSDFDTLIGIHPTCAELFANLNVTKSSGKEWEKTSC